MSPKDFETENAARWERLTRLLNEVEQSGGGGKDETGVEDLPTLFRQTCHDLSLAQHRMYGPRLTNRLNSLAIKGYRVLERRISGGWERVAELVLREFPSSFQAERGLFWFCMALFWLPFLFLAIWTPQDPEWAMSILGPEGMIQMEMMYGQGTSPRTTCERSLGRTSGCLASTSGTM